MSHRPGFMAIRAMRPRRAMGEPLAGIAIGSGIVLVPVLAMLTYIRGTRPYAAFVLGPSSILGVAGCLMTPDFCLSMFLIFFSIGALGLGAVAAFVALVAWLRGRRAA